jgi:hypothetical protein
LSKPFKPIERAVHSPTRSRTATELSKTHQGTADGDDAERGEEREALEAKGGQGVGRAQCHGAEKHRQQRTGCEGGGYKTKAETRDKADEYHDRGSKLKSHKAGNPGPHISTLICYGLGLSLTPSECLFVRGFY